MSKNEEAITALLLEARRRGVTYGALVAKLMQEEAARIVAAYQERRHRKRK